MTCSKRRFGVLIALLRLNVSVLALTGCMNSAMDTENNQFDLDCSTRPCRLHLKSNAMKDTPNYSLRLQGRYLLACAPGDSDFNCRPITCNTVDPCSSLGGGDFQCVSGLCEAERHALTSSDRLAVCLAGSGVWTGSPIQRARLTLVRSTPDAATIPAACR